MSVAKSEAFRFCPSCGAGGDAGGPVFLNGKRWLCGSCGFQYFHNVATAAGLILDTLGEIVFVERALEPRKGKLSLPGGFVNPGERAEDGALRECREEIGWAPPELSFLGSFPNVYEYGGVSYNTCDIYFYYRFPGGADLSRFSLGDGETAAVRLARPSELREGDLAFPSLVKAIDVYRRLKKTSRAD
jgi:ADP-ribose pyrophosphatase YjhB (NUDIX family)